MKLTAIALLKWGGDKDPILFGLAADLSTFGFFQRGSVKEMLTFVARTVAKRTQVGQRQTVQNEEYYCHAFNKDGLVGPVPTIYNFQCCLTQAVLLVYCAHRPGVEGVSILVAGGDCLRGQGLPSPSSLRHSHQGAGRLLGPVQGRLENSHRRQCRCSAPARSSSGQVPGANPA